MSRYSIVAAMLLHKACPQRGEYFSFESCLPWAASVAAADVPGVLFVSGYSAEKAKAQTPGVEVIQAEDFYPDWAGLDNWTPNDARIALYAHWLAETAVEAAFFTDATDVTVKKNPFSFLEDGVLYCGDEPTTVSNPWLLDVAQFFGDAKVTNLFLTRPDLDLLNCGVFGGKKPVVANLIQNMLAAGLCGSHRPLDMLFFNYAAYTGLFAEQFRVAHGSPVTSLFKAFENRNDVWFCHK